MRLKTSKNKEYEVEWAGQSITKRKQMLIRMQETRPMVKLISELDGIEWAKTSGPDGQPDREFEGPFGVVSASRLDDGEILISLERSGAE